MKDNEMVLIIVIILAIFLLGGFGMMGFGGYGGMGRMMGSYYGNSYGFAGVFGFAFMILGLAALILLIIWLARRIQK